MTYVIIPPTQLNTAQHSSRVSTGGSSWSLEESEVFNEWNNTVMAWQLAID